MKADAVQGYVIALSFLNMYESDGNKMDDVHKQIKFELSKIVSVYARKHDIKKWIDKAWKRFVDITNGKDATVDALVFSLQLVVKNPTIKKHKLLEAKVREAVKMFLFKREDTIKNAKKIVNKFYNLGE
jgi:hypothetical protein